METETVKCYYCSVEIPKTKLVSIDSEPIQDDEVACCKCIRQHFGEDQYNFWKSLLEKDSGCLNCEDHNHTEA